LFKSSAGSLVGGAKFQVVAVGANDGEEVWNCCPWTCDKF